MKYIFSLDKYNKWAEKHSVDDINTPWAVEADGREVINTKIVGTPYKVYSDPEDCEWLDEIEEDREDRKTYLLMQVLKMFRMQRDSDTVLNIEDMIIKYDGCECDGSCLCDDIMNELGIYDLDDVKEED